MSLLGKVAAKVAEKAVMRVFISQAGKYYKAAQAKTTACAEVAVIAKEFIDALPHDGSEVHPHEMPERIQQVVAAAQETLKK